MSNQLEPKNNTPKYNLTTESLGIADANAKDLAGFMLNESDISTAVMKILLNVGINSDAVRCIKVGCDENRQLKIIAEIRKKSLKKKKQMHTDNNWANVEINGDENNSGSLPKEFFKTLKNKAFYKHLDKKTVERRIKGGKTEEFIQLKFDADVLIAFVYGLNYADEYYRISCSPIKWMTDKEIKRKYDSNKQINRYRALKAEYCSERLSKCVVIVTFRIDKKRKLQMYSKMINKIHSAFPGADVDNLKKVYSFDDFAKDFNTSLSSGEFHPRQVSEFFGDDED